MKVQMRWMLRRDVAEVCKIEQQAFAEHAWEWELFHRHMAKRNGIAMTATIEDRGNEYILGYIMYSLFTHHIEIDNLAVDFGEQRAGIGTQMVEHLKKKLSPSGRHTLITHVSEMNLPACSFFAKLGFQSQLVRGFWDTADIDAVKFEATVNRRSPKWTELAV